MTINEKHRLEIVAMSIEGATVTDIAKYIGCSQGRISQILNSEEGKVLRKRLVKEMTDAFIEKRFKS